MVFILIRRRTGELDAKARKGNLILPKEMVVINPVQWVSNTESGFSPSIIKNNVGRI